MAGSNRELDLLRCAIEEPHCALVGWNELLAGIPLDDFPFSWQRMLPAILKNLEGLDPPEKGRMRGVHRYNWANNVRLEKHCGEALEVLADAGVRALVLKGIYLSRVVHRDLGLRRATDFDLLVPLEQAATALDALIADDWRIKGEWVEPSEGLENAVSLKRGPVELDLHWSLLREARDPNFDKELWLETSVFELQGREAETLSPTHHLFHLLAVADREPENRLRYLFDIHALMRRFEGQIEYRRLADFFRRRRILSRLQSLPLRELGWTRLIVDERPGLIDRLWSSSCRYLHGSVAGEWNYALYPILDYWFHFRGRGKMSLPKYLRKKLALQDFGDLIRRTFEKFKRLTGRVD